MTDMDDGSLKQSIDRYMDTNDHFRQDLQLLQQSLDTSDRKSVFGFSHQLDINAITSQDNAHFSDFLSQKADDFAELFHKRLRRRVGKRALSGHKIWFCLKYKNLSQKYHYKTYKEVNKSKSQLLSIDCLQIVSMSHPMRALIAKLRTKDGEEEWKVRPLSDTNAHFSSRSLGSLGTSDDRIYANKRQLLVVVGKDWTKCALNPIQITINYMAFTDTEMAAIYNGSHLQKVVLMRYHSTDYMLLSFDKMCPSIRHAFPLDRQFDAFLSQFPQEIQNLYNDRLQSNYSFGLSLSYLFADNVCLSGSFFRLKLGLLLNLLSLNDYSKRNHSSVLVICDDTLIIRRLFEWSTLFTDHSFLQTSISMSMSGSVRKQSSLDWIDSGALQLGADGITVITSACGLNELPEKERTSLFHALDTNEVIARNSDSPVEGFKDVELRTTVWAVIENNAEERELQRSARTVYKSQKVLWTEVFGMVYVIDEPRDGYFYQPLINNPVVSLNDWQQILTLMNGIKPQMSGAAEELLQNYFVANRRVRGPLVKRLSMEAIVCLTKASAKLSLRSIVTKYDALMAILLYEENLSALFPHVMSPLGVEPVFHVRHEQRDAVIGPNCDHFMTQFEQKLNEFIIQSRPKRDSNGFHKLQMFSQNEE